MTNVLRREKVVKPTAGVRALDSSSALDPGSTPVLPGRDALLISKLLVEVLQIDSVERRPTPGRGPEAVGRVDPFTADRAGYAKGQTADGPIASHVIRAAIHIYSDGPQTISQLAAGIGVSQGWASRVVSEMEAAGYVERERDPDDRRVVRVRLAPAAVDRVERVYRWRGDVVEAALEGMTPEERSAVATFLERFVEALRASG